MKKIGSLLGILAAILAIAAVVLSYLLFERRQEFRDRADQLAATVASMVQDLEKDSGTRIAGDVTFEPGEPGKPGTGTLGYQAYHEAKGEDGSYAGFEQRLEKAAQLAEDINARRNELAESLIAIAEEFKMPDSDYSADNLKNLEDPEEFQQSKDKIFNLISALMLRDEAMITTLVTCGNILGYNVTEEKFKTREQIIDEEGNVRLGEFQAQTVLSEFTDRVGALDSRSKEYAQTLVQGMEIVNNHEWEASANQIESSNNYAGALTTLLNDFEEINQQLALYETTKRQLDDTKLEMTSLEDELELTRQQLRNAEQFISRNSRGGGQQDEGEVAVQQVDELPENLIGHVVGVNNEWNFVILDLGRNALEEGREMIVARDENLVAKVQVSKVMRDISIAEVKPEIQTDEIRVGDRVILPISETKSSK